MAIEYRNTSDGIEPEHVAGFFVGWPSHPDPETHLRLLRSAYAVAIAWCPESHRVVGFANAISDGVLSAYIPLLEVLPDWQGQGIGKRLIAELTAQLEDIYMVDIVCDAELESFYRPLGFTALTGMACRNYGAQTGRPATGKPGR